MIHTKQKFALLSISRLQSTLAQIQLIEKKLKRDYKKNDAEKKNEQSNKRSSSRTRSCISVSERPTTSFQSRSKTESQRTKKTLWQLSFVVRIIVVIHPSNSNKKNVRVEPYTMKPWSSLKGKRNRSEACEHTVVSSSLIMPSLQQR